MEKAYHQDISDDTTTPLIEEISGIEVTNSAIVILLLANWMTFKFIDARSKDRVKFEIRRQGFLTKVHFKNTKKWRSQNMSLLVYHVWSKQFFNLEIIFSYLFWNNFVFFMRFLKILVLLQLLLKKLVQRMLIVKQW